ncbi:MAG: VCBS repeat-containing protein [bacterium]|nr:VCBS repeat-containing protein [bacterium]
MMKSRIIVIVLLFVLASSAWAAEPAFIEERHFVFKTSTLTAEEGFSAPCVYDWNNDGLKDLITASGAGKILVYINRGNNSAPVFDTAFPVPYKGSTLVIPCSYTTLYGLISTNSDLNGDGLDDLIVGVNNKVYFYKNTGSPGSPLFNTEKTQIRFIQELVNLIPDDLENDVGAFELLGNGQGVAGAFPNLVDVNGDGKKDIISSYTYLDRITPYYFHHCAVIYTNVGTTAAWNFVSIPGMFTNYKKISSVDIVNGTAQGEFLNIHLWHAFPYDWDNDGTLDLIGTFNTAAELDRLGLPMISKNIGAEKIELVWWKGGAGLSFTNKGEIITEKNNSINLPMNNPLFVTKWDADSEPDVLCGNHLGFITVYKGLSASRNRVHVEENYTRNIQISGAQNNLMGWNGVSLNVVDFNDDGNHDIIFGNLLSRCYYVLNEGNNQDPVYRAIQTITIGTGVQQRVPVRYVYGFPDYYDWNNDGRRDFVFGGGRSYELVVFTNINDNKNPVFSTNVNVIKAGSKDLMTGEGYSMSTPCDWNDDGQRDLITIGGDGVIMKYLSTGNHLLGLDSGTPLRYENGDIISLGYISSKPYILDWDGDGKQDLVGAAQSKIFIFLNKGDDRNRRFDEKKELQLGGQPFNPGIFPHMSVLDFDGDGYYDIVIGEPVGSINIYYGGPARFVDEDDTLMPGDKVKPFPNPVRKDHQNIQLTDYNYINSVSFIRDSMNIEFSVRDDSIVDVFIYTLSGKLVRKIYGDAKYNYRNAVLFDYHGLANGTYIVKIRATSKMNKETDTVVKSVAVLR